LEGGIAVCEGIVIGIVAELVSLREAFIASGCGSAAGHVGGNVYLDLVGERNAGI